MNPRGLLVAYEEHARVKPVASDFDAFTFGSRGLDYPMVPKLDVAFLVSMIGHTEQVIAPHLTLPYLTSPHLTSPRLASPHLASPHLT